jgi:hypothetical protein
MGSVPHARLVGYWSDEPLYQGAMEAADIAFRADGTGWTYWSRSGGTFFVRRFTWHTTAGRQLTLDLHWELSGTWDLQGHTATYRVTRQAACGRRIVLAYQIHAGQDILGRPATLLEVHQPISLGTIGDRFALSRELAKDEPWVAGRHKSWTGYIRGGAAW